MNEDKIILGIPIDKLRITPGGRLDFPDIYKICLGKHKIRSLSRSKYYYYGINEKCKTCLWYFLGDRIMSEGGTRFMSLKWIKRNQKFSVCRVEVKTIDLDIWRTKIDELQEDIYNNFLPDILKAYESRR